MKTIYITEDPKTYIPRIATFVFVAVMAIAVRYMLILQGSEVFVGIGIFGLAYSIYSYFYPKKLLRLDEDGIRNMETHITVPWSRIQEITVEPFVEGEYVRDGMRHLVCRGYSPRAEGIVEWWRLGVSAKSASQQANRIMEVRKQYMEAKS